MVDVNNLNKVAKASATHREKGNKEALGCLIALGMFILVPIAFIYGVWAWGTVFWLSWAWLTPHIHASIPPLTFAGAIALRLLYSVINPVSQADMYVIMKEQDEEDTDKKLKKSFKNLFINVLLPWMTLLIVCLVCWIFL